MDISVVTPVYNEEGNIKPLCEELEEVLSENYGEYEIILVDDGSKDSSYRVMEELAGRKDKIKAIKLRKNFGQSSALQAGINKSKGKIVVTIDSDLQNDPSDIPRLVEKLEESDASLVNGWRKKRNDPLGKKFFSKVAEKMRRIFLGTELHDYGCTLKAFSREVAEEMSLNGEMHRYIPPIIESQGFKSTEIVVNHRERHSGKTKYGLKRIPKGFMDMINVWFWQRYRDRPLHIFGGLGIFSMTLGGFMGALAVYQKLNGTGFSDTAATIISPFLILLGVQFFISGLTADILIRNYYNSSGKKAYRVKEVIE